MESASCTHGLTGHQDVRGTRWDQSDWWICCRGKTQGSRGVASFLATILERGAQMGKPRLHFSGQKQTTSCKAGWPLGDSLPPPPVELPPRQVRLYPDFTFLPCSETCRHVRCHGTVMHVQHPTDKVPRWHGGRGLGLLEDKRFSEEWCTLCISSGFAEIFLSISGAWLQGCFPANKGSIEGHAQTLARTNTKVMHSCRKACVNTRILCVLRK